MRQRLVVAAVLLTACDHGSTVSVDLVAQLPVSSNYVVGFTAIGTPLLASTREQLPIAHAEGGAWIPSGPDAVVTAFGNDFNGTPLVVFYAFDGTIQLGRLLDSSIVFVGNSPLPGNATTLLRHPDGSQYVFGESSDRHFAAHMAFGSTMWKRLPFQPLRARYGVDGAVLVSTMDGVMRIDANEQMTTLVSCATFGTICTESLFGGIDASGAAYFAVDDGVVIVDPARSATLHVELPGRTAAIVTSGALTIAARFDDAGKVLMYLLRADGGVVPIEHTIDNADVENLAFETDLDGHIYVSAGDFFGALSER